MGENVSAEQCGSPQTGTAGMSVAPLVNHLITDAEAVDCTFCSYGIVITIFEMKMRNGKEKDTCHRAES